MPKNERENRHNEQNGEQNDEQDHEQDDNEGKPIFSSDAKGLIRAAEYIGISFRFNLASNVVGSTTAQRHHEAAVALHWFQLAGRLAAN